MVQSQDKSTQRTGVKAWAAEGGISWKFVPGARNEEEQGWYL